MPDRVATMRGWAVVLDDQVVMTAGIAYTAVLQAFSVMDPAMHKYPKVIMQLGRRVRALCGQMAAPVYALADEQYDRSGAFLERIGFVHQGGNVYRWEN